MKRIKFLLAVMLLVAVAVSVQAQGFEWAVSYSSPNVRFSSDDDLKGSFVDVQGNTYIVGHIAPGGQIFGVDLLPQGLYSGNRNDQCVIVAKISSDGQLVWHKTIYASESHSYAYGLSRIGDTAFMVMCAFPMTHYNQSRGFLYFLDTLLTSSDAGYLTVRNSSFCNVMPNCFITFDLDGNVIEKHILEVGFVDSSGTLVTSAVRMPWAPDNYFTNRDALSTVCLSNENFTVDNQGNIYVIRHIHGDNINIQPSRDSSYIISFFDGSISALNILVDGQRSLRYNIEGPTPEWNQQILKFSSHFDSLLGSVYMFDSTYRDRSIRPYPATNISELNIDRHNRLYVFASLSDAPARQMYVNNSDSLFINNVNMSAGSFVVVYDSALHPLNTIQTLPICNDSSSQVFISGSGACSFDDASNSVFVSGVTKMYTENPSIYYKGDTIPLPTRNTGFWLRLDMDSLNLRSYGFARTVNTSRSYYNSINQIVAGNNRVFGEVSYGDLSFADSILGQVNGTANPQTAFLMWDQDGHELEILASYEVGNHKHMYIVDSAVYITGTVSHDITFDAITLHGTGDYQSYIARYVDTAFMTPYMYYENRIPQTLAWPQELRFGLEERRVALTATSSSGMPVSYRCNNSNVAYVRGDTLYLVGPGEAKVTARQNGSPDYEPARPVTKPLYVGMEGITSIAQEVLTLYPNPTTGVVQVGCDGCTVKEATVISALGRRERVACRDGRIDLSHLAAGVYYLEVRTDTGVAREKITKL